MRKYLVGIVLIVGISQAPAALAVTAQETLRGYEAEARKEDAAFKNGLGAIAKTRSNAPALPPKRRISSNGC